MPEVEVWRGFIDPAHILDRLDCASRTSDNSLPLVWFTAAVVCLKNFSTFKGSFSGGSNSPMMSEAWPLVSLCWTASTPM